MSDDPSIIAEMIKSAAANSALIAGIWGASGGLTSALVIDEDGTTGRKVRSAIRQIVVGALAAAGGGTALGGIMAHWMGLPAEAIPAFGTGGAVAYMTGVFGPAMIEVVLLRIRAGRLPSDGGGDA